MWILAAVASGVVFVFLGSMAYYGVEEKRTDAVIAKACLDNGGSLLLSWNNKYYCEAKKDQSRVVP